jgi:HTH-type transcriptional regulator, sugar sensing transcriptional regulator
MLPQIKKTLKNLGFKESEIKVYVALTELGEAVASEIAKRAGLARTTTISILNKLDEKGYLTTHKFRGKIYYWIESPQVIEEVFQNKAKLAGNLNGFLSSLYKEGGNFPFGKIYDTKEGVKKFTENILLKAKKKSIIYTIDTPQEGNYKKVFSEDLEKIFFAVKKKRQLFTKTLVPNKSFADIARHKIVEQDIELREMPAGLNYEASFWIVGEVICFFSGNPPFLAVINHGAIKNGLKSIYDFLWSVSQPLN